MLAYIDPGSGAIVLQVVIAGFLAAGMVLRRYFVGPIRGLLRMFSSKPRKAHNSTAEHEHRH